MDAKRWFTDGNHLLTLWIKDSKKVLDERYDLPRTPKTIRQEMTRKKVAILGYDFSGSEKGFRVEKNYPC